jgi:hypothetical protein
MEWWGPGGVDRRGTRGTAAMAAAEENPDDAAEEENDDCVQCCSCHAQLGTTARGPSSSLFSVSLSCTNNCNEHDHINDVLVLYSDS